MRRIRVGATAFVSTAVVGAVIATAALALAYQSFHPAKSSPFRAAPTAKGTIGANSISYSQSGKVAAVSVLGANRVSIYQVQPNNSLRATNSIRVAKPIRVQFNPKYSLLAVYSQAGKLFIYTVASGGKLKLASGSPVNVAGGRGMAWNSAGTRLAVTPGGKQIKLYSVARNGVAKALSSISDGGRPVSVSFSPFGARLAVANQAGRSVSLFNISNHGKLSRGPSFKLVGGASPSDAEYNPGQAGSVNQIAVVGTKNAVSMLRATATSLTLQSRVVTVPGDSPRAVAFTMKGQLALACFGNSAISVWGITSGGRIAERQALPVGKGAIAVTYTKQGRVLAAASQASNTVSVFSN